LALNVTVEGGFVDVGSMFTLQEIEMSMTILLLVTAKVFPQHGEATGERIIR
jgi:hypothetical protein